MAAASPQLDSTSPATEAISGHAMDDDDDDEDSRMEASVYSPSMRDKDRKIGHRRVDKSGIVSYKKDIFRYYDYECNLDSSPDLDDKDAWLIEWLKRAKPTSELMAAIQLGIGQSVGGLSAKPERDVLMQDFGVVEVVFFPGEGSNLTPAHHYSDFRFKTYAPVAFRYFRDLFGIQPDDFMLSLCDKPLKELSNPGASGSIFYLTQDDEFIIKTVQHKEADFLQKLLPGYFLNISQNKRTLLPKFYGLFCYQCGGKNIRFTVMNNLLPTTVRLHEKYDMKGSTYKRKASKHERSKSSPTLKDLDFMDNHTEGLLLEKDTYDALIKTMQRDCRVLESFKIMDYSLLVGIYNLDIAKKEKQQHNSSGEQATDTTATANPLDAQTPSGQTALQRGKSFKTRIGQYSTPMESIQGNTDLTEDTIEDEDVPPGGIPARNSKGESLLLYLGIIDILQSFRLKKRLEHTVKSMVIDGDTISVHRPSYYAHRFLQYHATRVFKKTQTALKHSPSKKRSLSKVRNQPSITEQSEGGGGRSEKTNNKAIIFSDSAPTIGSGAVGGKPDLLPEISTLRDISKYSPTSHSAVQNVNGNSRQSSRSESYTLNTYGSDGALSARTASTASLRGIGSTQRGPSPPLSVSESTPTHTEFTEGTPSFTNSSPSCSSDVMASGHSYSPAAIAISAASPMAGSALPAIMTSISNTHHAVFRVTISSHSIAAAAASSPPAALVDVKTTTNSTVLPSSATHSVSPILCGMTTITATSTILTSTIIDMGSTDHLDGAGIDSSSHSPGRSPDLRHHSRSGRGGAASPLVRPSQLEGRHEVISGSNDVMVTVTPESPSLKASSITETSQNRLSRVSEKRVISSAATVVSSSNEAAYEQTATESECRKCSRESFYSSDFGPRETEFFFKNWVPK